MAKKRASSSTRRAKRPAKAAAHRSRAGAAAPDRGGDGAARTDAGRALWSGTISFGLVTIPVNLFPARRAKRTAMHLLTDDGTPLRRRWCCPKEQRLLDDDEIVRGYE